MPPQFTTCQCGCGSQIPLLTPNGDLTRFKYRHNRRKPFPERFWAKVNKDGPIPAHRPELGPCWVWTGCRCQGYGYLVWGGKAMMAHRASWQLHHGSIQEGANILHHCDNPSCIRPSHLFTGTQQANIQDMIAKGRKNPARGERHRRATNRVVIEAILSEQRCLSFSAVGRKYGVGPGTVRRIWNGEHFSQL